MTKTNETADGDYSDDTDADDDANDHDVNDRDDNGDDCAVRDREEKKTLKS